MLVLVISRMAPGHGSSEHPNFHQCIHVNLFPVDLFLSKMSFTSAFGPPHSEDEATEEEKRQSLNLSPSAYLLLEPWAFGTRDATSTVTAVCLGSRERGVEAGGLGREACRMALMCP